jgi:hypothetical protein
MRCPSLGLLSSVRYLPDEYHPLGFFADPRYDFGRFIYVRDGALGPPARCEGC